MTKETAILNDIWSEESIGYYIGRMYRKMVQHISVQLRPFDITTEQFSALFQLYKSDEINQKELANRTSKDQPTTTRILDALERKGLIEKKMCKTDRRAYLICLTTKGRLLMDEAIPVEHQALEQVFAGVAPEQMEQLKQLLQHCTANIQRLTNE
jgi:DNA-binding MarR family transcriptional regulator